MEINKDHLLNKSKVFCILPWVHAYVEPTGDVLPCCTTDGRIPLGSVKNNSIKTVINNEGYKQMRLNMLNDVKSEACKFCYKTELTSPWSFRDYANKNFGKYFDETVANTNDDGSINDFKMRYYDIRFSNICNFKCRTCGSDFSSQWAAENKKFSPGHHIVIHADDHKGNLLNEVYEHINNIEMAYFAGGEPLITEEHYLILEELIKHNRTDVILRYNTNLSNLKFKDYDLISLWKQFKKVEISASIDHYGERAEYIRHGTNWGDIENNLKLIRTYDFIEYQFNTVMSVFNYTTLADFYSYMWIKGFYRPKDQISLFKCMDPAWASAQILPEEIKSIGTEKLNRIIPKFEKIKFYSVENIKNGVAFAESEHTWDIHKNKFQTEVRHKDKLRGEDFCKVFPEMSTMMEK
jgi:MoaA/NifB/PqqE/SkfB family radical SAM enzyme